jgi:hypothetical protein
MENGCQMNSPGLATCRGCPLGQCHEVTDETLSRRRWSAATGRSFYSGDKSPHSKARVTSWHCPLWQARLFPASRPGGLATRAKSALSHPYRFSPYNTVVHPPRGVRFMIVGISLGGHELPARGESLATYFGWRWLTQAMSF